VDGNTSRWLSFIASWLPFLLLLTFWLWFFLRKGGWAGKQRQYIERSVLFMERQEQLLERIAAALEQRNRAG
jgi:ATP-dependent Zn protease